MRFAIGQIARRYVRTPSGTKITRMSVHQKSAQMT
jgi:hypothetical protein